MDHHMMAAAWRRMAQQVASPEGSAWRIRPQQTALAAADRISHIAH